MKGIVLAGGAGTRLYPLTRSISKQLMPVYDKPMVYYPLSILMMMGIREVLIISTPRDLPQYRDLLNSGEHLGMKFTYLEQPKPGGLPQAFILGAKFIGKDNVTMINGDNVFYGAGLRELLQNARAHVERSGGHMIFGYHVPDPERSGVVEFDSKGNVLSIEEKPAKPKSHFAIAGLYVLDNEGTKIARRLKPSARGELEMVDIHKTYLRKGKLKVGVLGRGIAWLDTGTHASLLQAGNFVRIIEERQGLKIGCIEEIAYRMGFITKKQLKDLAGPLQKSGYGNYLMEIAEEDLGPTGWLTEK